MKKLLLLTILVLIVSTGFAQVSSGSVLYVLPDTATELTADTPAVDMTMAQKVWASITAFALFVLGFLGRTFSKNAAVIIPKIVEVLTALLKGIMHFRGSGVVIDTGMQVVSESGYDLAKKLEDGKLTKQERDDLVRLIRDRSVEKLKGLFGFYKKDLEKWAEEQAGVFVGKLLYRNSSGSGSKIPS